MPDGLPRHTAVTEPLLEVNLTFTPPVQVEVLMLKLPLAVTVRLPPGPPKPPLTAVVTVSVAISSELVTSIGQSTPVHLIVTFFVALMEPWSIWAKSMACRMTVLPVLVLTISTFVDGGAGTAGFATVDGPWTVTDLALKVIEVSPAAIGMLALIVSAHVLLL